MKRVYYKLCLKCDKPIALLPTHRGRTIAVNRQPLGYEAFKFRPVDYKDLYYMHGEHQPHRMTCDPSQKPPRKKRYV